MSPALANFLFEAANFVLLAGALGFLLFRPIRAALAAEEARHADMERTTAERRAEADRLLAQARTAQSALSVELDRARADALAETQAQIAAMQQSARVQQQLEQRAQAARLEAARRAQLQALADSVGEVAAASVSGLMNALPGPNLDAALCSAAARELTVLSAAERVGALVESARPLPQAALCELQALLPDLVEPRLLPELGAGVRVTTAGAGQIDCSARHLSQRLAHAAIEAIAREEVEPIDAAPAEASPASAAPIANGGEEAP